VPTIAGGPVAGNGVRGCQRGPDTYGYTYLY